MKNTVTFLNSTWPFPSEIWKVGIFSADEDANIAKPQEWVILDSKSNTVF